MLQSFPLVRLAALDLDGTLLNRNNEVTLATRQAIARAVEHGVVVVLSLIHISEPTRH